MVCLQVALLNWLSLGSPDHAPGWLRLGARLNGRQWSVVHQLLHSSWDVNSPSTVTAVMMGRAAAKFETFEAAIDEVHMAAEHLSTNNLFAYGSLVREKDAGFFDDDVGLRSGTVVGNCKPLNTTAAKELIPDRLKFPSAPRFDPVPFMDNKTAAVYEDPIACGIHPSDVDEEPPKVQIRATRDNLVKLYRKLFLCGRLEVVPHHQVRHGFLNGLFSVGKDMDRDRMILDGRPANLCEQKLDTWTASMAASTCVTDFVLAADEILLCSGEDLKDCFYQFVASPQRTARNTLCEPLSAEEASFVFDRPFSSGESPVFCGLCSLAMGDTNACEFAQSSHLSLCLKTQALLPEELLYMRGRIPRTMFAGGIVIDDLIFLERTLRELLPSIQKGFPTVADHRLAKILQGYDEHHLEYNPGKEFRNQLSGHFWGVELDGDKGIVRPSSNRLWPLIQLCSKVCTMGWCSISLLEAIAGCWVSILGLRRRLLCLMDVIFEPLGVQDKSLVIKLSDALIGELWSLVLIGPLCGVNLKAQFAPFISATDASMDWLAAVRAPIASQLAQEFSRRSLRKGIWSRLLPPGKAWLHSHGNLDPEDEVPDEKYDTHPLWSLLARSLSYKERWRQPVRSYRHINVLELKAYLREERLICHRMHNCRLLSGLDSQVSLGSLVKGRASSSALNNELRYNVPHILGSDVYSFFMYFPSELNRADQPTRHKVPDGPDRPLPSWWTAALQGDFEGYDSWLDAVENGVVSEPFDVSQLQSGLVVKLHSSNELRRNKKAKREVVLETAALEEPEELEGSLDQSELSDEVIAVLKSFDERQFFHKGKNLAFQSPGALDLFSGSFGVAKQMVRLGCPWVLTFEWTRSASEDLLDAEVRSKLLFLIRSKAFKTIGAALICCSFSVAVTPPVRSSRFPRGKPGLSANMRLKVSQGNSHADFLKELIAEAEQADCRYWFENPDLSWLFRQKGYEKFRDSRSDHIFRCSFCRFGTPWRKNTRFGTDLQDLAGLRLMCKCKKGHKPLRGFSKLHKKCWTAVAEPYPRALNCIIAGACCAAGGWSKFQRLDVASCCRSCTLRVGEASNPGPRRVKQRQHDDLLDIQLVSAPTAALESRLLKVFVEWCSAHVDPSKLELVFDLSPLFLAQVVCKFGLDSFRNNGALSNFRHLILAVQKWKPSSRVYMRDAWDLVSRWEISEPVQHRPPVPEVVVLAMVVLAWQLRWFAWVGATLIAFFGAGRIGEVLRCQRRDLLLPSDSCGELKKTAFLKLAAFKALGRQPARVQHMKISDPEAVALLERIYSGLDKEESIFGASPAVFRRRWDFLLRCLDIPAELRLTPGGMRGGSAVHSYRSGISIPEILWNMRLRQQSTLESYLQETAALGVIQDLQPEVRLRLQRIRATFPFLRYGSPGSLKEN
eukprot:Skav221596  [mRNA]  locus=scaffold1698:358778:363001:+ [translate_table: standard]